MSPLWVISTVVLWALVLLLGFLLLGTLRSIEWLRWRVGQLEATMPSRVGRSGLRPGKKAPDFTLPSALGGEVSLHDYTGRKVLVVFTQTGCGPCGKIVPELNRLERDGVQVLVVNRGSLAETSVWAAQTGARCPVLAQEGLELAWDRHGNRLRFRYAWGHRSDGVSFAVSFRVSFRVLPLVFFGELVSFRRRASSRPSSSLFPSPFLDRLRTQHG